MKESIKESLINVLKKDGRIWDEEKTEINKTKLLDLVGKYDETLIDLLLNNEKTKKLFFLKVKDVYVFKLNDFRFFIEENQVHNSFTNYKNIIGLSDGDRFLKDTDDIVLNWPYKDCILEGGQSTDEGTDTYFEYDKKKDEYEEKKAKRKEIFFNEVLAKDEIDRLLDPKAFINWKRYTNDGEQEVRDIKRSEDGTIKENLIIKGNNLLALHSIEKQFAGKVKLIYIDPPYNTGNDSFQYNDKFNHSTWLTFMKNRLEIAKKLLRNDGSIWINIDDTEAHYLKVLADEVFGRNNFIANIVWQKKFAPQNDAKYFSDNHDHILIFGKSKESFQINYLKRSDKAIARYKNPDNDKRGPWASSDLTVKTYNEAYDYPIETPTGKIINPPKSRCWRTSKANFERLVEDNRVWFGKDGNNVPRLKRFLTDVKVGVTPMTIWTHKEVSHNQDARKEITALLQNSDFDTPKPENLLKRIIHIGSNEGDIILDYFGGSATTAAVATKMRRQFITTEQMNYIQDVTLERLKKVLEGEQGGISKSVKWNGGSSFIYLELAEWNESAKNKIKDAKDYESLVKLFDELSKDYFLHYNVKINEFKENIIHEKEFKSLILDKQKELFLRMLDNNQLYVNRSEMEDSQFELSKADIELTKKFYGE